MGRQLEKGVDLDAGELELFELAWDANARARCRQCKGECAEIQAADFHRKPPLCGVTGCSWMQARCKACGTESKLVNDWQACIPCGRLPRPPPEGKDSALLSSLKRQHENLRIRNNVCLSEDVPTAKKRKRT